MVANDKNPSEAQQATVQKEKKIIVHSPRGKFKETSFYSFLIVFVILHFFTKIVSWDITYVLKLVGNCTTKHHTFWENSS